MGLKPYSNAELGLEGTVWKGKAPLWYYTLKESEIVHGGKRLGPVGGRIVAETILGILALDKTSYFYAPGGFVPQFRTIGDFLLAAGTGRHMGPDEAEAPDLPEQETEEPHDPEAPEAPEPAEEPTTP
jgi:hypothetical protein